MLLLSSLQRDLDNWFLDQPCPTSCKPITFQLIQLSTQISTNEMTDTTLPHYNKLHCKSTVWNYQLHIHIFSPSLMATCLMLPYICLIWNNNITQIHSIPIDTSPFGWRLSAPPIPESHWLGCLLHLAYKLPITCYTWCNKVKSIFNTTCRISYVSLWTFPKPNSRQHSLLIGPQHWRLISNSSHSSAYHQNIPLSF